MAVPFQVLILGSGSAIPNKHKNHTSQLVIYNNKHFLFDCGEGSQARLKAYGGSVQKIDHIFISHLHGDHYLGLPGLVFSMNLLGREKKLTIYGPPDVKRVLDLSFELANSRSSFIIEYVFTTNKAEEVLFKNKEIEISSFPVRHKIPTTGFKILAGSTKRKLLKNKIEEYNIPKHLRSGITEGKDYTTIDGKKIRNEEITAGPENQKQYAYCADTSYLPDLKKHIQNPDLMYHETSFLKEDEKRAKLHFHSTAEQAATLAKKVGAKKLLIGHFSNKYTNDDDFIKEARSVFPETYIAREGGVYEV